ncbi:MAG TPA: histidine--tRNA ligase [Deltaproteobacteria bacterium]|nr:histidine--tRNA ligase [Deltaproteobacteria bacterium]
MGGKAARACGKQAPMAKIDLQPPRGTRDFYPEDMRVRSWLFDLFRQVARLYAFEEVDAPIVEHAELFIRKAGEEIVEQLYHFTLHDRHLALRSEMTPSIARMVMARAGGLRLPLRWFAITQNWRYERTTRGRRREHYQWNMDIWGERGVGAEAELISAITLALERLGLGPADVKIRVNSRALLEETLREGILRNRPEAFEPLCVAIDKLSKIGPEAVCELLCNPAGAVRLAPGEARNVVELLGARSLEEAAAGAPPGSQALEELRQLFQLLEEYGCREWVVFDASVVRGLAYYTGIVFEAYDTQGKLRAICGGGRYDRLLESMGGAAIPAVGFGFGDAVILELLADRGLLPARPRDLHGVVFAFGDAERPAAIALAKRLRRAGHSIELVLGHGKLRRVLQDADRAGAERVYLIGPDEAARGEVKVRNLRTGEEETLPL